MCSIESLGIIHTNTTNTGTLHCATLEGVVCHLVSSHEHFHVSIDIPKPRTPHKFVITLNPDKKITSKEEIQKMKSKQGPLFHFIRRPSCFKRHVMSSDLEEPTKRRKYFHSRRHVPRMVNPQGGEFDSDDETDESWKLRLSDQLLDEFTDISRPEKLVMMLWNHFVAEQPIYSESAVDYWAAHFCRTCG